jgi:hypothetical protein
LVRRYWTRAPASSRPYSKVSPFNEKAVGDLSDWQTYRGPTRDYDETVYNVVPYGDEFEEDHEAERDIDGAIETERSPRSESRQIPVP